jgi:hypothetical protein
VCQVESASVGREGEESAVGARSRVAADSPPYLESESPTPEAVLTRSTGRVMCKRLGCGSVWCPCGCGVAKGLALRDSLKVELETFTSPYFITLTVDPVLFPEGPEGALRWVQDQGVVSEFVRALRRRGHLLDTRYVSVLEFQENGWPHWHLIFDALFVPFDEIALAWAAAGWAGRAGVERWGVRPKFEGKGQRPVFGSVSFRKRGRESLGAICHYLTKYVTKMPAQGWPEWLLKTDRQLRRWSTSRDFWRHTPGPKQARKVTEFSKLRGKYFDPDEEWEEDDEFLRKIGKTKKTIGQRLEGCGAASVVLEEVEVLEGSGQLPAVRWRYLGMVMADVWRDPKLPAPTFKALDDAGPTHFVVKDPHYGDLLKSLCGLLAPTEVR